MARTRAACTWRAVLAALAIAAAVPATALAEDPPSTSPDPGPPPAATNPSPTKAPAPVPAQPEPAATRPAPTTTRPASRTTTGPTSKPTTRTTAPRRTQAPTTTPRAPTVQSLPAPGPSSSTEPQTSCRSVAHIGDSLSVGLDSPSLGPDARISARYAAAGVRTLRYDASGGRSVVETVNNQDGGETLARKLRQAGFHGCWVIALGTNDAADVDAGSPHGYSERIDRMMAIIGDDPVLWVDAKTRRESGFYAAPNMRLFDQALAKAHARYPDLQVYEWSEDVADDWFQPDGIHYNAEGSTHRAALLATALADAFPD